MLRGSCYLGKYSGRSRSRRMQNDFSGGASCWQCSSRHPHLWALGLYSVGPISSQTAYFLRGRSCGSSASPFSFLRVVLDGVIILFPALRLRCVATYSNSCRVPSVASPPLSVFGFFLVFLPWISCCCWFLVVMCGSLGLTSPFFSPLLLLLALAFLLAVFDCFFFFI